MKAQFQFHRPAPHPHDCNWEHQSISDATSMSVALVLLGFSISFKELFRQLNPKLEKTTKNKIKRIRTFEGGSSSLQEEEISQEYSLLTPTPKSKSSPHQTKYHQTDTAPEEDETMCSWNYTTSAQDKQKKLLMLIISIPLGPRLYQHTTC